MDALTPTQLIAVNTMRILAQVTSTQVAPSLPLGELDRRLDIIRTTCKD